MAVGFEFRFTPASWLDSRVKCLCIHLIYFISRAAIDNIRFVWCPRPSTCNVLGPFVHETNDIAPALIDTIEVGLRRQYRHAAFLNPQVIARLLCSCSLVDQDPCELAIGIIAIELVLQLFGERDGRALDVFDCRWVRIVSTRHRAGALHINSHKIITIYNLFTNISFIRVHARISHRNIFLQIVLVIDLSLVLVVSNDPEVFLLSPLHRHILVLQRIPLQGVAPSTIVEFPCLAFHCQAINLVLLELREIDGNGVPVNRIFCIVRFCHFVLLCFELTVIFPYLHRIGSVHFELELAACQIVERIVALAIACRRIGNSVTVGRVNHSYDRVEVALRIDHGASLHLPVYRILLCVFQRLAADVATLEQLIVVEGSAKIHLANLTTLKLERLVDVDQSAEHLQFDASLARKVVGVRQCTMEHSTQSGI